MPTAPQSVAIIGGGPAGLSAARLLAEQGVRDLTVFEAQPRVGGKSLSVLYGGAIHDLGTCYSTFAHSTTNRWMRQLGIKQVPLGKQVVDGAPLMKFVAQGPGPSVVAEVLRYVRQWSEFQKALAAAPTNSPIVEEAALPVAEWLKRHGYVRMHRFMLRALTSIGYSHLDEISTVQALRWCTPSLIMTGVLNSLKLPVEGWQTFWERLTEGLDVRCDEPVVGIERDARGVTVTTAHAGAQRFGHVLITTPVDELDRIMKLSDAERFIAASLRWNSYVVSLFRAENWFTNYEAEAFSEALESDAPKGAVLSARRVLRMRGAPSAVDLYLCGQYGDGLSPDDLKAQLARKIAAQGGELRYLVVQKNWKYFPRYELAAIREGLLQRMAEVQGQNRTWYSGATFSHEAVSNIVAFNRTLMPQIRRRLAA